MFNDILFFLKEGLAQWLPHVQLGSLGDVASTLLTTAIFTVYFLYGFFGLYVLVMGLYRAHLDGPLTKGG